MRYYVFAIALLLSGISFGQNRFGQFAVDAGPSYNAWRGVHRFPFQSYDTKFAFTVGAHGTIDWAMVRQVSLGVGFSTQKQLLYVNNYQWSDANGTYVENVSQYIQSFSFCLRGLFHPLTVYEDSGEMLDLYFGVQQTWYSLNTWNTSQDPDFPQYDLLLGQVPAIVGGVRFMPTEFVGLYLEASLPGTYTVALGASFRFGGRDKFFGRF